MEIAARFREWVRRLVLWSWFFAVIGVLIR